MSAAETFSIKQWSVGVRVMPLEFRNRLIDKQLVGYFLQSLF
jgi:hypothetical protein